MSLMFGSGPFGRYGGLWSFAPATDRVWYWEDWPRRMRATFTAFGVSVILARSAAAFTTVKLMGAAYLVHLGVKALRSDDEIGIAESSPDAVSLTLLIRRGIVVNVLNPKVAIFFLAFFPQFVDSDRGSALIQMLALGLVFFVLALALDLAYALLAARAGAWLRSRPRVLRYQRFLSGSVYIGLGAAAAVSSAGEGLGTRYPLVLAFPLVCHLVGT